MPQNQIVVFEFKKNRQSLFTKLVVVLNYNFTQ